MKTMEEIKQLKHDMLTQGNALRGYSNVNAVNDVTRTEGELDKLKEIYIGNVLIDDLKNEYILSELNKVVWNVDDEELAELLKDRPEDSYYNDASMWWLYEYIHGLFDDIETLEGIDHRIAYLFGHYGCNYIVKNGSQFYILFEW